MYGLWKINCYHLSSSRKNFYNNSDPEDDKKGQVVVVEVCMSEKVKGKTRRELYQIKRIENRYSLQQSYW